MTIDSWISDAANNNPDKPAIVFHEHTLSYNQFASRIDDRVAELVAAGIVHGDRVAWYGLNHPDVFVLLFSCARLGAILVPLNWRLASGEIEAIVSNCEPKLVYHDEHFRDQAQSLASVKTVSVSSLDSTADAPTIASSAAQAVAKALPTPTVNDRLLIVYTSGSTGKPKGVVLTQKSLISNARMSVDAFQMTPDDKALVVLPLFHVGGLNILPTPAFSVGATVVLHEKFEPDSACLALADVTVAITVPTVLQAIMQTTHWPSIDLGTIKALSIGSTDVPVSLIEKVHLRKIPMLQIYGATETGPFAIYQSINDATDTVGSIGRKGCDCEIRLVKQGEEVPIGEPGEIWVKGDNVLLEYWQDDALTQATLQNGWFQTGDVARVDNNGYYWFTDRIKHVIISGGENIYPTEIERVLNQLPGVVEVAVVGMPDSKWGEIPVAAVVTNKGLTTADILEPLKGQLARYKHPKSVVFVDALPRNAMGKIVAADVKQLLMGL